MYHIIAQNSSIKQKTCFMELFFTILFAIMKDRLKLEGAV